MKLLYIVTSQMSAQLLASIPLSYIPHVCLSSFIALVIHYLKVPGVHKDRALIEISIAYVGKGYGDVN
jgi:hypothetical protein